VASSPASSPAMVRPTFRTVTVLAAAVVVAVLANAVIAAGAFAAGAMPGYGPLTFPAFTLFTAFGIVAGWIGWTLVYRHARAPRRVLTVLVPTVALVSMVPDVVLLVAPYIPGTNVPAVIALMLMHLVVLAVAVAAYSLASRSR
jgi:hypothetical protein